TLNGTIYKSEAKLIAAWCAAIVYVLYTLINNVTAEKILVSKKIDIPIGIPIFNCSIQSEKIGFVHSLKIAYRLKCGVRKIIEIPIRHLNQSSITVAKAYPTQPKAGKPNFPKINT